MVFRNQELFLRSIHIAMYTSSVHSMFFLPSLMVDSNVVFENTAVRNGLLLILYGPVYVYLCRFREWQIPLQNGRPHSPLYQYSMNGSLPPQIFGIDQLPNFCQMNKCAERALVLTCFSLITNKLEYLFICLMAVEILLWQIAYS